MTTSAASRLRQHQRVTPLAARLAAMGLGDPAALCTVHAPLTGSLALTKGAGSITHSRADTFAPTTTDHEGIVRVCKTGEVRFWGLRRIENLISNSEGDLSTYAVTGNAANGIGITGYGGAIRLTGTVSVAYCYKQVSVVAGRRYALRVLIATDDGLAPVVGPTGTPSANMAVTLCSDVFSGSATVAAHATTAGLWWVTASYQSPYTTTANFGCVQYTDQAGRPFRFTALQVEDVTNQSNTSAGEYVSTGVASAPSYHGANVDGVRYYATTQDGAAIAGGGLLVEGSAQNLLGSTDMTHGVWTGLSSVSNDGTYALGLAMCKLTKTVSGSEYKATSCGTVAAGWYCGRIVFMASANCTQAAFEIFGSVSADGANADSAAIVISGPGTLARVATGSYWSVTGLSTTIPTVIEFKRSFPSAQTCVWFLMADTYTSTAIGKAVYAAVGNMEAGSICTSRIPTAGSMLTRPADSVTLPTSGNLCAEWGAMSATVTWPSVATSPTYRTVLMLTGQNYSPMYFWETGSLTYLANAVWGASVVASIGARTPGVSFNCASVWRGGEKLRVTYGGGISALGANATSAAALPSTLTLGNLGGGDYINGAIRDLKLYGLDLTAAQLQTVTT